MTFLPGPALGLQRRRKSLVGCCLLLLFATSQAGNAGHVSAGRWSGTFLGRVEALALLQTLNAELLSHDSATLTLERWCNAHRLASPARVTAQRVPGIEKVPSPAQRLELAVMPEDAVRYRRVRLLCGMQVLSEADNWYVPGRLTPAMNAALESTDIPFGRVVQPLHFERHTLSATLLWRPLPEGWEMRHPPTGEHELGGDVAPPREILQHRALLTLPDGRPFSEVVETYTINLLAFPAAEPAAGPE